MVFGGALAFSGAPAAETPRFLGSNTCGTCHQAELEAWVGSHHAWALKEPTSESVLGDFEGARFEHDGVISRFFRKGDRYFVETDGADGKRKEFEISYVVGVAPLQQYLVELDRGRLQALDIAWDTEHKRWFHLYPGTEISAGNGLHWTGPYKNWQARCAVCHQTDFRKNYEPRARGYQSSWSELTVGCEACHGPGEAHAAWAERRAGFDPAGYGDLGPHGLLRPQSSGRQAVVENMCGPCHSRREAASPDSTLPGEPFGDHYNLMALSDGLYFADGQQQDEVYVLGSFLQSKMHEKGVTCTNCHDPHSGRLVAQGNAVCTQCHNEAGRSDFPTLKTKDYDSAGHHHHQPESAGARCVSCHMPERNYMVVDGRRDHFFRVPDPLLSEKLGSPDACLSCHSDKAASWAAAAIRSWNPGRSAQASPSAELFFQARTQGLDERKLAELVALAQNRSRPGIVRATALRDIGDLADPTTVQSLAGLLSDGSDLVRVAAVRLWRSTSAEDRVAHLQPLLSDKTGSVRIAAALELANVAPEQLPSDRRQALQAALAELRASMAAKADFPEGQLAIGGLAMVTRNWDAAQAAFAEATFMDPQLVQAWHARARIAEALGDIAGAAGILSDARGKNPGDAAIASQLANLLMQQGRVAEAIPVLRDAVSAEPDNQDMRIALALALLRSGDLPAAGAEIDALRAKAPERAEVLMLRGLWQVASGDSYGAAETVRELERRYPNLRLPPGLDALAR